MHFEDYNYELFNKYILIDPNKGEYDETYEEDEEEGTIGDTTKSPMVGYSVPPGGMIKPSGEDEKLHKLNEKNIELSIKDSYQHEVLSVKTGEEILREDEEAY